jgi:hypothetical protein
MLETTAAERPGYQDRSALALALAQAFLAKIREAGASEEEAIAALRSAEAMVPVMELYSRTRL